LPLKDQGEGPTLASHPSCLTSCVIVRFAPQATAAEISRFLNAKGRIRRQVDNGNFTLQLTETAEIRYREAVLRMQGETKMVDFVAAVE